MQKVSFIYKGVIKNITGNTARETLGKVIDFLYKNGYSFSGPIHNSPTKRLLNKDEYENILNTQSYAPRNFHKVTGEEKYIISNYNTPLIENFIKNMIINFGLTEVETSGFEVKSSKIKKFGEIDNIELDEPNENEEPIEKMTFAKAAQVILQENDNVPMTGEEIWDEIVSRDLVDTTGKTPKSSLISIMRVHSVNGNTKRKLTKIFQIVSLRPSKFILINPTKIQDVPEEEIMDISDKYYLLGAYDSNVPNLWKQYVESGCWINGFADGTDNFKLKDEVNQIPIGSNVAIKSSYVKGKVNPVIMIKARGVVTKNYGDGAKIDVDWEKDFKPFEIQRNDVGGYRQTLHEISNKPEHIDLIFNLDSDLPSIESEEGVTPFSSMFPTDFKDSQTEEEIELEREFSPNPFRQAICVLGKSGKGKSTTVEKILDVYGEEMDYDFIIPTASTTNLLSQYSPVANDYIKSRLGKLIMNAYKEHDKLFTAVFDECHKSNVIEMINDELLQCISLYRNQGNRFISLDDDTAKLYKGLKPRRGNLLIPDNVGFIFLSSKPDVIISNSDFFNRVDIYVLTKQPPRDKEDISFEDAEYFTPVGNRENGSKSLEDIDRIKELNDAD